MTKQRVPLVVLVSGSGSNLQAIIDATSNPDYPAEIVAVISNIEGVKGLERAKKASIPTAVLDHKNFPDRESYDFALHELIDSYHPEIIVLAGFMRILTDEFVNTYLGKMLNIHPSLLPKYKGLNTHQKAIDAGDERHGATVHFVTPDLDSGPLIIQAEVPVLANDTSESLAARVLEKEHQIYPLAIEWLASGRISMTDDGSVLMDNQKLQKPYLLD
ncbi:MAG: phosphoribosylglycinamide formyltransferase [Gammaproteobacteria bacterium]|jgi:phosphoribosylglycinamide formyltransferase 1